MHTRRTVVPAVAAVILSTAFTFTIASAQLAREPAATNTPSPAAATRVVDPPAQTHAVDPPDHKLSTSTQGGRTHSELGVPTVSVTSDSCATGKGADVRLGLMKNTAVYGHCSRP